MTDTKPDQKAADLKMSVTVNLPPQVERILIDSRAYTQGGTYSVSPAQYETIMEIMSRAWKHDREVTGAQQRAQRAQRY